MYTSLLVEGRSRRSAIVASEYDFHGELEDSGAAACADSGARASGRLVICDLAIGAAHRGVRHAEPHGIGHIEGFRALPAAWLREAETHA